MNPSIPDPEPIDSPTECPACGSRRWHGWRTAQAADEELATCEAYELDRCDACGTAWIGGPERVEEAASLYEAGVYAPRRPRFDRLIEVVRRAGDLDRMRFFRDLSPGSSVFDVGSGDNRLLTALTRAGFRVSGNEPAEHFAAAATELGLEVAQAPVETVDVDDASLDAVVLWHVLEHLDDPGETLALVRSWLRPGGRLVVAVPNLASLQASIGGDRWFHQDVPRHRTQFTRSGVTALLQRSGFSIERTTTLTLDQSLLGMWQTLLNRLTVERDVLFRQLKHQPHRGGLAQQVRDLAVTAIGAPVLAPVAAVLEVAAAAVGYGGSVVACAAKAQ